MRAYRPSWFGGRDPELEQEIAQTKRENMERYRRLAEGNLPLFETDDSPTHASGSCSSGLITA